MKDIFEQIKSKYKLTDTEIIEFLPFNRRSYYSLLNGKKRLTLQEANTICGEWDIPLDILAKAELEQEIALYHSELDQDKV